MATGSTWAARALMARRKAVLGRHSPMFYDEPLHVVSGQGVWLRGTDGIDYLDAYNNVAHVGHCNPAVVRAIADQAALLNVHTRYLHEPVVEYAEALLATFDPRLDKVLFTNSGSESNELALRIARQHTGNTGIVVTRLQLPRQHHEPRRTHHRPSRQGAARPSRPCAAHPGPRRGRAARGRRT